MKKPMTNRSTKKTYADGAQIGGEEIYTHVREYVTNYVRKIFQVSLIEREFLAINRTILSNRME